MKVLQVHNAYQNHGGEDTVLKNEKLLLESNGHKVSSVLVYNKSIQSVRDKIVAGVNVTHSAASRNKVMTVISDFSPDIVHVHNFFPLLTPSIYDACNHAGVPVIQTLHNYRTICPGGLLMRKGNVCEECVSGSPYRSVLHVCYRN